MKRLFISALFLILLCQISSIVQQKKVKKFKKDDLKRDPNELFEDWYNRYGKAKHWAINSAKGKHKKEIFLKKLLYLKKRNSENLLYEVGLNQFSAKTPEEMKLRKGLKLPPNIQKLNEEVNRKRKEKNNKSKLKLTKFIQMSQTFAPLNWTDLFLPARAQGECGSCWAFATASLIEGHVAKRGGNKNYLSTQQWVNCDKGNNGCEGGFYQSSLDYAKNGIISETALPYAGVNQTCNNSVNTNPIVTIAGYQNCIPGNCTEQIIYDYLQLGPVATAIDADGDFSSYTKGIYSGNCSNPNHAVVLVGYGIENTIQYWIVRNSWGINYGENGYIRVLRNQTNNDSCFLTRYGFYPTF